MTAEVFARLFVIFIVVAIGWIGGRWFVKGADAVRAISALAFYVLVPALLFRTSARIEFARLDANILLAYFAPVLATIAAVYAVERARAKKHGFAAAVPSVRTIGVNFGNTVQIGIPLAAAIFGEAGLALHITIVSLHALIILTTLTALVELDLARSRASAAAGRTRLRRTLATTVRQTVIHPVVLPVLAGLAWNVSGLPLPAIADDTLVLLGEGVVPVCLVLIGMSLAAYGLHGTIAGAAVIAALKLLVLPAVVLVVARYAFGLTGLPLSVVVMMSALPVGTNALLFAQRYATREAETTTAIVVSTAAFVVTGPLWLALLGLMR